MKLCNLRLPLAAFVFIGAGVPVLASDIFNGREVYDLHCQTCHGAGGQSIEPGVPDFSRGEALFAPDVDLVSKLRDGHLPSYRGLLSDDELRDVVAYLRTLQR